MKNCTYDVVINAKLYEVIQLTPALTFFKGLGPGHLVKYLVKVKCRYLHRDIKEVFDKGGSVRAVVLVRPVNYRTKMLIMYY